MHICYISCLWPPQVIGGAEVFAAALANAMAERSRKISVITLGIDGSKHSRAQNITLFQINPWNIYNPYIGARHSFPKRLIFHVWDSINTHAYGTIIHILKSLQPDIVHTHNLSGIGELAWLAAKRLGIPVVHTAHDLHLLCPRTTLFRSNNTLCIKPSLTCLLWRQWHLYTTRWVDWFICPSEFYVQKHLEEKLQAQHTKIIRNGVTLTQKELNYKPLKRKQTKFLYLGQLAAHKGILDLLEAFSVVVREGNQAAELYVAGKGPLEPIVHNYANQVKTIKYIGFVTGKDKDQLLANCDVLVQPSKWYEASSLSILEAFSYGLPVIASRIGALPEIVTDRKTGLLVEPGNVKDLASAIREIAWKRETILVLKEQVALTRERFDFIHSANAYDDLYCKISSKQNRNKLR